MEYLVQQSEYLVQQSEAKDNFTTPLVEDKISRDFVVEAFIVNEEKILLVLNRKLNKWLPPGGHIDPHELPDEAVKREVREETGLEISIITDNHKEIFDGVKILDRPYLIQLEDISEDHQHIDLVYIATVNGSQIITENLGEVKSYKWFDKNELEQSENLLENVKKYGVIAIDIVGKMGSQDVET